MGVTRMVRRGTQKNATAALPSLSFGTVSERAHKTTKFGSSEKVTEGKGKQEVLDRREVPVLGHAFRDFDLVVVHSI